MTDTLDDLRAIDVASALALVAPGADVEISLAQRALIDRLLAAGLVAKASDAAELRRSLDEKKTALAGTPSTDAAALARARREILDLSEALASADGAARLRTIGSDGPYRGTGASETISVALTHAGRALLSNLGPRAERAPDLGFGAFAAQLAALDALFAMRARRALELTMRLRPQAGGLSLPEHALRSAMLGLAALPHPVDVLGDAFMVLFTALRHSHVPNASWSPVDDAATAEALLLHYADPGIAYAPNLGYAIVSWRQDVTARYCAGRSEDGLDATLMLAAVPEAEREARIARAAVFASAMGRASVPMPLSLALLATAAGDGAHLVGGVAHAYGVVSIATADPMEALTVAVIASLQTTHALDAQLARIRALHGYLTRIAPNGMMVGAALLALLDGEPAGLLDDLRLASKAIQEQRLVPGGAEATTLAVKLLLHSALLARGNEGDPEESLALALRALPEVAALDLGSRGLGTVSLALPIALGSVVAFHRPMLDATVVYDEHSRPMHSDYVFGGGTGYGGGYGHHPHHHRSIGWG